ncbi:SDR family oxidoreductase [Christensenellaceae bacterium OttesenSCG-928-K19]|nr:SDR family oxidoreductase [Christensenellaceae bacterium OttesenSCG-928-K19]
MEKRVAIVTGGTRGMGQDISVALAKAGNIVYALYRSDEKSAMETKQKMQVFSEESDVLTCNVADKASVGEVVSKIGNIHGRIDILVNNAGVFDFCFIEDITDEYFDRVFNVNFKGQLYMIQACVPYMKKHKYGRIANASSISSSFADCGLIAYGASKASIDIMTKTAAGELAPYGITVNSYAPGIIHTDMTDSMITERGDTQVKQIALQRFGTGEDAAALVCFLVSPQAGYVTGEIIGVDGGFFKVQNPIRAYEYVKEKNSK